MEEIKYATPKQIKHHIEKATRDVASWPLWKADPDTILAARKQVKEWDEKKMNDEVLAKILEALESIDKRLAILELRPNYLYTTPAPFYPDPWYSDPWKLPDEFHYTYPYTGDPLPDLPTTTCGDKTESFFEFSPNTYGIKINDRR